jgi:hypothetical protein
VEKFYFLWGIYIPHTHLEDNMFYSCVFDQYIIRDKCLVIKSQDENMYPTSFPVRVELDLPKSWSERSFAKHVKKGGEVLISFKKIDPIIVQFRVIARPGKYKPQFRMWHIHKGRLFPNALVEEPFSEYDLGEYEGDWRHTKDVNEILEPLTKIGYIHKINIKMEYGHSQSIVIFERINPPPARKVPNESVNERISGVCQEIDTPDENYEYKETPCDQIAGVFNPIND